MVTSHINRQEIDTQFLNCEITFDEVHVHQSTLSANREESLGNDGILIELLNNRNCIVYLTRLFNSCLKSSTVPELWSRGIIR